MCLFVFFFFFSSRRRHTRWTGDWSSDVCSSDLYPLPEAQLDRFMMKVNVGYPSEAEEIAIAKRATTEYAFEPTAVLDASTIEMMQSVVRKVPAGDHVYS